VGRQLVQLLLSDTRYEQVKVFTRRNFGMQHNKLRAHEVDFDDIVSWKKHLTGDVLYSSMGTTLKLAGGKEAQYKVDYTYQYQIAKAASANGVKTYVLVSAAGSNPTSRIFYSRMKGELERDIMKLPFETIQIVRPGMLAGERVNVRMGEVIGNGILSVVGVIPGLGMYIPIPARVVAQAMINATFRREVGIHSYTLKDVFRLAEKPV
jgi:uncharacterized protein YbjT (DUF2867 family)